MKPKTDLAEALICNGVDVQLAGSQYRGTCPFCDKENHFYVKAGSGADGGGQWDCKSCGEKGNVYTFLNRLVEISLSETTDADYSEMWRKKRIAPGAARLVRLCKSYLTGEWIFPSCRINDSGKITTLTVHRWNEGSNRLYATDMLPTTLIGRHLLNKKRPSTLIFDEGHWDFPVMTHLLRSTKQNKQFDVLATPGAQTFRPEWCPIFKNYERIYFIYDGDHPKPKRDGGTTQAGLDGMKKAVSICRDNGVTAEMKCIQWPEGLKSGYDVRDLFIDATKGKLPK